MKNRDEPRKFDFTYDLDLQPYKSEIKEFIIDNPSDDFRRKCLKGGCTLINTGSGGGNASNVEYKKPKRPEDSKTNKIFTDLFGAPLDKQKISKSADKNPSGPSQTSASSSSSKDKGEKSGKHKHPSGDGKDNKKSGESSRSGGSSEKVKKDKNKDRDRGSDKKEKSSKRPPSPSRAPSGNIQNQQNLSLLAPAPSSSAKNEYPKPAKPQTPIPDMPSNKKSSKKKNYEKDREKNERKEATKPPKDKGSDLNPPAKSKEKDVAHNKNDDRQKPSMATADTNKVVPAEPSKKYDSKHSKHRKKESKEKDRKEPKVKSQPIPVKSKSHVSDKNSDSDSDSVTVKQEETIIPQKNLTPDKPHKKASSSRVEKPAKVLNEKETDTKKRKKKAREPSRSPSPAPLKQQKRDTYSPMVEKTSTDTNASLNSTGNMKVTSEYLEELKDLKQKINTLQTKDLHHVVRLIASTGHYEITKSSFDFDLVKIPYGLLTEIKQFVGSKY